VQALRRSAIREPLTNKLIACHDESNHPRGVEMRFVVVAEEDGAFTFVARWGETMVARSGDAIVQDLKNPSDTYRIAKAAFACTYEVISSPEGN
jgi:hypothetical protein